MSTPLEMLSIQQWMSNAACKGNTKGDWFPEQPGRTPAIKIAMDICNSCPVKIECLEYAMTQPNLHGIWGGLSARKRGALRAKRNKGE